MSQPPSSFRNPVIPGFFPDPSVCRAGGEYFVVVSSFVYAPGVPIFRSLDLVHWEQIGNVLDRPSQLDLSGTGGWDSMGVYAPTIRHHDGRFWMATTVFGGGRFHNFFVTTDDPAGPWSEPVTVDVAGIDPDLAWDVDGNCWLHHSTGHGGIRRCRIDDVTGAVLEGPDPTWSGTGKQYPEAPHLYERDGTWYLLIAEGGTERGHSASVARGPSPIGPWESCPDNPIVTHRGTDRPIQNVGHGDLVEAGDGSWWIVLLGIRPRGTTPGFHVLGREVFLAPVRWVDGWPVVDSVEPEMGEGRSTPVEVDAPTRDGFDADALHPAWISVRRSPASVSSLTTRSGWLTLNGTSSTLDDPDPTFVGRRQQHHSFRARTMVDPGSSREAGIAVRMDPAAHYEVAVVGDRVQALARVGPLQTVVGDAPRPPGPVTLTVAAERRGEGPDMIVLGYVDVDGAPQVLAELDGRYLSTEVATGFVGRVIGMYAVGGAAAFDWFAYEEVEDGAHLDVV